jgi:hypothetical protein
MLYSSISDPTVLQPLAVFYISDAATALTWHRSIRQKKQTFQSAVTPEPKYLVYFWNMTLVT